MNMLLSAKLTVLPVNFQKSQDNKHELSHWELLIILPAHMGSVSTARYQF